MSYTLKSGHWRCHTHGDYTEALVSDRTGEAYHRASENEQAKRRPITYAEHLSVDPDEKPAFLCGPMLAV